LTSTTKEDPTTCNTTALALSGGRSSSSPEMDTLPTDTTIRLLLLVITRILKVKLFGLLTEMVKLVKDGELHIFTS
jgi:hypothetical protein